MKVLQVVPHIGEESSGPSYSVPGLCRGLAENGVETRLSFLGKVPERLKSEKYKAISYPQHDKLHLGWSPEMLKGLREACKTADIIHDNSLWMMPNVYPAWAVKGTKCKLVVAPRGTLAAWSLKKGWLKKKIFGWLLQNRVLRRADMFHATSEKEYEEIRALGYQQPVAIVPIGMDIPDVSQFVSNSNTLNSKTQTLRQVVFFGRLHKVKAVDRLVQAWEILTKEQEVDIHSSNSTSNFNSITNWELVIAGPDGGIRSELEQYISDHKIPRVRFVGEINGPSKYEFLADADLYVLPSHTENFAVTVAEALACGTPVIVSKGTPWQGVEGEDKSKLGVEVEDEGRGNRSTVEFGNQSISRRALAEKKVDEWLRGVSRESFVSALGKLVEEKTAAGEYRFRRPDERDLALKGAERFYDELDYSNQGLHNLTEVTVLIKSARKNPPPIKPLSEVVEAVERHQGAGYLPSTIGYRVAKMSDRVNGGEKPLCQPSELLGQGEDKSKLRVEVEERRLTSATSNTQTLKHSNNSSRCGFWVSNDPETLAKTLCEAMSLSDAERRQMGEVGREWIRRDFSWEGVGAKMKAAYKWLLDGGERPEYVKI